MNLEAELAIGREISRVRGQLVIAPTHQIRELGFARERSAEICVSPANHRLRDRFKLERAERPIFKWLDCADKGCLQRAEPRKSPTGPKMTSRQERSAMVAFNGQSSLQGDGRWLDQ